MWLRDEERSLGGKKKQDEGEWCERKEWGKRKKQRERNTERKREARKWETEWERNRSKERRISVWNTMYNRQQELHPKKEWLADYINNKIQRQAKEEEEDGKDLRKVYHEKRYKRKGSPIDKTMNTGGNQDLEKEKRISENSKEMNMKSLRFLEITDLDERICRTWKENPMIQEQEYFLIWPAQVASKVRIPDEESSVWKRNKIFLSVFIVTSLQFSPFIFSSSRSSLFSLFQFY